VVNDQMREHVGKPAIGSWAAKEMIGDRVTMYVTKSGRIRAATPWSPGWPAPTTRSACPIFHFTLAGDAISRSSRLGLSLALIGAIAGLQVSTDPPNILDAERRVETAH
jgi:hypothetical protein